MKLSEKWQEQIEMVMAEEPLNPALINFHPERIILAKGAKDRPHRRRYIQRLTEAYPRAEVIEMLNTPHNRIPLPAGSDAKRRRQGKRTLVLGTIGRAVNRNNDKEMQNGIKCTHYWHFNCTFYCYFDCAFCYLSGNKGVSVSPTVRLFLNVEDILEQMLNRMENSPHPILWYAGKLQDSVALDPICNYSKIFVPFMAQQEKGRLLYLTKSDAVDNFLSLDHQGHTIMSWSINAKEVARRLELQAPPPSRRLQAAKRCQEAGYEIRLVFMPLVPIEGWKEHYAAIIEEALATVTPSRITLGGICSYPSSLWIMKERFPSDNTIATHATCSTGRRIRYEDNLRIEMYQFIIQRIRAIQPDIPISLCLETAIVWNAVGLDMQDCRCNCLLDKADVSNDTPSP